MTSLFMGHLVTTGVPADESVVRNTATPVNLSAPPAMQEDMPEMGEVETDPNPDLGMVTRQLASHWIEGTRGVSSTVIGEVSDGTAHNAIINQQVSSSGFSAGREASGQSDKNLSYAVGIEAVGDLRDGGKMGNQFFVRNERNIQDGMRSEMTVPPGYDTSNRGEVLASGKDKARKAAQSPYDIFWNGGK